MKSHHLWGLAVICSAVLLAPFTLAQERTAGSSLENQMTWTALSSMAKNAADKADMVDVRVNQIVVCSRKKMLYAPGMNGADSEGCVTAVDLTSMQNTINSIISCAASGGAFNGTNCIANTPRIGRLQCRISQGGGGTNASYAGCAADEMMTGGGAMAETPGSGLCGSSSTGFLHASHPQGNGWVADAYSAGWRGEACVLPYAVCCKVVQ